MANLNTPFYDNNRRGGNQNGVESRDNGGQKFWSFVEAEAGLQGATNDTLNQIPLGPSTFPTACGWQIGDADTGTAGRFSLVYDDGSGAGGPNADGTYELIKDVEISAANTSRMGDGVAADLLPFPGHLKDPVLNTSGAKIYILIAIAGAGTLTPPVYVWAHIQAP